MKNNLSELKKIQQELVEVYRNTNDFAEQDDLKILIDLIEEAMA